MKANEAYEKGLRTLVARSEPFGFDRFFNRYYCFSHDPEFVFVEMNRSVTGMAEHLPNEVQILRTSWHVIDKVSMLDLFAGSLDVRGTREKALYEALMGTEDSPQQALKNFMHDDVKEKNTIATYQKERKELEQKLEDVRLNIIRLEQEEGRRPSRFQSDLVLELESQIAVVDKKIATASTPNDPNYAQLTGLELLRKFDNKTKRHTRRSSSENISPMPCTNLIPNGGTCSGIVGWIVDEMLHVEKLCQDVVPWEAVEARKRWISELEKLAASWNEANPLIIGPEAKESSSVGEGVSAMSGMTSPIGQRDSIGTSRQSIDGVKRRKVESPASVTSGSTSQLSLSQIISHMKVCFTAFLVLWSPIYVLTNRRVTATSSGLGGTHLSSVRTCHGGP